MFVLHEPTLDGLLSAVAWCLRRKEQRPVLLSTLSEPLLLPASTIPVEAGIRRLFGRHLVERLGQTAAQAVLDRVHAAFLSEEEGIGTRLYRYLYLALLHREDPAGRLQDPDIAAVVRTAARVGGQAHRYLGLLRFRLLPGPLYLAQYEPDANVLPLIWPHFIDRLQDQPFVIYDRRRSLAAWYQPGRGCRLVRVSQDETAAASPSVQTPALSAGEPTWPETGKSACKDGDTELEQQWQCYLKHLSIPQRRNLRLQQANMPKKYWQYLTERQSGDETAKQTEPGRFPAVNPLKRAAALNRQQPGIITLTGPPDAAADPDQKLPEDKGRQPD